MYRVMVQKITLVVMLCLVILAGVLVLVFSQTSCPSGSTCLQIQECYSRHQTHHSLKDVIMFNCSDDDGRVCCPAVPGSQQPATARPATISLMSLDGNKRLLPMEECGTVVVQRIIGGQLAAFGQFPWMALLLFKINGSNMVKEYLCGGTLISKKYVLTAAHCLEKHGDPISVRLGESDLSMNPDCDEEDVCAAPVIDVDVEKVVPHESYNTPFLKNDIALIRLKTNAPTTEYIRPICLPFGLNITGEEEKKKYTVAGWGRVEDSDDDAKGSKDLLFTSVSNSPISECDLVHVAAVRPINELQLCAGDLGGNDACNGDSGGPLMETSLDVNGTARSYQVGIVSFKGSSFCGGPEPSVYTRVTAYLNWILRHLEP